MTSHNSSSAHPAAAEIRRIVAAAKAKGILRGPGDKPEPIAAAQAANGAASQWLDIDPQTAERMLCANTGNRAISRDTVNAFAREMIAGEWQATHQGIAFDTEGKLIDGQHRLAAIAESKTTVRLMVTYDIPAAPEGKRQTAMDCIDRGRPRTTANQLKLQHGIENAPTITALCTGIANLCAPVRVRRIGVGQTLAIYREYKESIDYFVERRSKEKGIKARGVSTGFVFALAAVDGLDADSIKYMWDGLTGNGDIPPIVRQLREFLVGDDANLLTRNMDRALAELTLQVLYLTTQPDRADEKLELAQEGVDHYRELQADRVACIVELFSLEKAG